MIDVDLLIGIIGMSLILIGFFFDEFFPEFNSRTIHYNLINLFGAGALTYYSYTLVAWPFFILNIVWMGVAGVKLVRISTK